MIYPLLRHFTIEARLFRHLELLELLLHSHCRYRCRMYRIQSTNLKVHNCHSYPHARLIRPLFSNFASPFEFAGHAKDSVARLSTNGLDSTVLLG